MRDSKVWIRVLSTSILTAITSAIAAMVSSPVYAQEAGPPPAEHSSPTEHTPPAPPATPPATTPAPPIEYTPPTTPSSSSPPPARTTEPTPRLDPVRPSVDSEDEGRPLWTGTARLGSRYNELGATVAIGGLLRSPGAEAIGLTGISIFEHHGLISKIAVAALVAMGQSDRKHLGSTTTVEGRYIVRRDYYRSLTPAERAAQAAALQAAIEGEYTSSLTIYGRNLFGVSAGTTQGSGAEFNLGLDIPMGMWEQLPIVLTLGLNVAYINSSIVWKDPTDLRPTDLRYANFGLLARLHIPVTRFADVVVEWHPNFLAFAGFTEPLANGTLYASPLRLGMYLNLTDRAYVKGQAILSGFGLSDGRLGYQAEAGVRF